MSTNLDYYPAESMGGHYGNKKARQLYKMSAIIKFDDYMSHQVYAAADFYLMPSLFEPCGLSQLIAMRYGVVPVVRKTGGLGDTVSHFEPETGQGHGIVFNDYLASALLWATDRALSIYHHRDQFDAVRRNAMQANFSWEASAQEYLRLYETLRS